MRPSDEKVVSDWLIATRDTIYQLQQWQRLLETWRDSGHVVPEEFATACQQLAEAGLWNWAREAGGHGIEALIETLHIKETL